MSDVSSVLITFFDLLFLFAFIKWGCPHATTVWTWLETDMEPFPHNCSHLNLGGEALGGNKENVWITSCVRRSECTLPEA